MEAENAELRASLDEKEQRCEELQVCASVRARVRAIERASICICFCVCMRCECAKTEHSLAFMRAQRLVGRAM